MNVPQNLAAACDAAIAAAPNNAAAWQAALDAVLANNGIAQTFHLTQPQAQLALQLIVTNVTIPSLDALLNANGINYLTTPNGHNSQEYMALLSLFYNGGTNTVGPSLLADLVNQNRAAAWYEIRYQTDANDPNGAIERRRYYESNVFGLSTTADTYQDALQDYEVLTQHRPVILGKEVANVTVTINGQPQNYTFGADPDGAQPEVAPANSILAEEQSPAFYALGPGPNQFVNQIAPPTLSKAFDPEAQLILQNITAQYGGSALPQMSVDTLGGADTAVGPVFYVRSTDIFVAPPTLNGVVVNAGSGDPGPNGAAEAGRNHIIIGTDGGDRLIGGHGNDVLIAGAGLETLNAGTGSDTLIGGSGNDVLNGGPGDDVFDVDFRENPNASGAVETIDATAATGRLYINGSLAGGVLSQSGPKTWTDGQYQYQFIPANAIPPADLQGTTFGNLAVGAGIGELKITSVLAGASFGTINLLGFNLTQAESSGFFGFSLPSTIFMNAAANAGVDPPAPDFQEGSQQSYTLSVDAPSAGARTFTVTLSGAIPSDFEALVGDTIEQLSSSGTFSVVLGAEDTSVSFALLDATADNGSSDIAAGASLTLGASLPDPFGGDPIQAAALTFNYVPSSPDTTKGPAPGDVIIGQFDSVSGITTYTGDGGDDLITATGNQNRIDATNSGNDSITANVGSNTITGSAGNDVISVAGTADFVGLVACNNHL